MHRPLCPVSLCLIFAGRLGCTPSHPDIRRRDPPSAFHRLLPDHSCSLSPPPASQPPFHSPKLQIISPADSLVFWSLLTTLQAQPPIGAFGTQSLKNACPLPGPQPVPPLQAGRAVEREQRPDFNPDLCQSGLLRFTTLNSSSAQGADFDY